MNGKDPRRLSNSLKTTASPKSQPLASPPSSLSGNKINTTAVKPVEKTSPVSYTQVSGGSKIKKTIRRAKHAVSNYSKNLARSLSQKSGSSGTERKNNIFDDTSTTEDDDEKTKINPEILKATDGTPDTFAFIPMELIHFPDLLDEEKELFQLVEEGQNILLKQKLLQMDTEVLSSSTNIRNCEGDTLFHRAVRCQNVNIVETLLTEIPNTEQLLYDILMVAVSLSDTETAKKILQVIKSNPNIQVDRGKLSDLPRWKHSEFDKYMSPIMMAALIGNYELIALFSAEGEKLETQLTYNCRSGRITKARILAESKQLINETYSEDIVDDYQRLHEYQALTSPEMMCFLANTTQGYDPLLKTFHYINELQFVKSREVEFRENYQAIIDSLTRFSIHLVSMCESSQELDLFFSRTEGYHGRHDRYPRIVMAMEMGLKEFVSHPHTQRVLYNEWAGQDWKDWRYFSTRNKFRQLVYRIFCIPAILFSVFLDQGGKEGKLLTSPIHRCLYSGISHCVFLFLALIEHLLESSQPNERIPANKFVEIALVLIVAGKFRALIRQFFFAPHNFSRVLWNWYEIIYCCLFCVTFVCWYLLHFSVHKGPGPSARLPMERQFWKANDLLLIADIFLALGTIMACGQLLRYVQLHNKIGPIQIALGEMMKSFANFALFFLVILSSFSLGLTAIYAPYKGMENRVTGEVQQRTFTRHSSTLIEMYWDLFGGADPSAAELITISVTDPNDPSRSEQYEHYITELTGKILYSVYSFFGPTILFSSILIGFISRTFGNILEENDVNWRFHRAQIWMYFARASVMPPPFNLIPSLWDITSFFGTMQDVRIHPRKYFVTCNCASCFHLDNKLTPETKALHEEMYFNLIKVLVRRYFRFKSSLESTKPASPQDVAMLNKEIKDLNAIADQVTTTCTTLEMSTIPTVVVSDKIIQDGGKSYERLTLGTSVQTVREPTSLRSSVGNDPTTRTSQSGKTVSDSQVVSSDVLEGNGFVEEAMHPITYSRTGRHSDLQFPTHVKNDSQQRVKRQSEPTISKFTSNNSPNQSKPELAASKKDKWTQERLSLSKLEPTKAQSPEELGRNTPEKRKESGELNEAKQTEDTGPSCAKRPTPPIPIVPPPPPSTSASEEEVNRKLSK